ncbi:MAG TPA: hypothetical protein DCS93_38180 [Microscillaceae bacterium]|nr:hypothetical protein [Microscillaceae bacterium]
MKSFFWIFIFALISPLISAQSSQKTFLAYTLHQGKIGFIDPQGNPVIPVEFDNARLFSEGLIALNKGGKEVNHEKKSGKWGFWSKTGKAIIPLKYEDARAFTEGLALVKLHGKYGFINKQGKVIIDFQYENAKPFSNGLAAVKVGKKWGFIDKQGKMKISPGFNEVQSFHQGFSIVFHYNNKYFRTGKYGRFGLLNPHGKLVLDTIYDDIHPFKNGFARVESNQKTGFINTAGKIAIPIQFDAANDFSEGFAAVAKYITTHTKPAYTLQQIDSLKQIHKRRFPKSSKKEVDSLFKNPEFIAFLQQMRKESEKKLKYGYINSQGKVIVDFQFKYAQPFKNGLAHIQFREVPGSGIILTDNNGNRLPTSTPHSNDRYNAVDKNGQLLSIKGTTIVVNQQPLVIRSSKQGTGVFNENGETYIAPGRYHSIHYLGNGFFVGKSEKSGHKTLFTASKVIVSHPNFSKIEAAPYNRFCISYIVEKDGNRVKTKSGIMDAKGQWILKPTYDFILPFNEVE